MFVRLKNDEKSLCNICKYEPFISDECRAKYNDVKRGYGKGNDNVIQCRFFDLSDPKYAGLIRNPETYEM